MNVLNILRRPLRKVAQKRSINGELDEELRFHLEQRTAENMANGMPREEAAREARRRFGNLHSIREECRDVRGVSFGEATIRDIYFGLRMLKKNPGFTTVIVLTLSLGIGANTGIFSLLNTAIIRPLPYNEPDRLVVLQNSYPKLNLPATTISPWLYFQCREACKTFQDIGAIVWWSPVLTGGSEPAQVNAAKTTANFGPLLGVAPQLGRYFSTEEDQAGHHVAVLSDGFWRRRFGSDAKVIGQMLLLDGVSYEVIGVLPAGLKFIQDFDIWAPMAFRPADRQAGGDGMIGLAKLRPGISATQAEQELESIAKPIRDKNRFLADSQWKILARPVKDYLTGRIAPLLTLLLSAVIVVLLIACVNVATLLLAAGVGREKEMAIRTALGAGRVRLIRQLLVEALVVSLLGAVVGCALAKGLIVWISGLVPASLTGGIAGWDHIHMDFRVLAFTMAITVVSALLFGLAPALQISRSKLTPALNESGSRSSQGLHHRRLRTLLVIGEIALATTLLTGAGLLLESFLRVLRVEPGFNPQQLVTGRINLPERKYPSAETQRAFFDKLLEKIGLIPGVASAALISNPPLWGGVMTGFLVEGREGYIHGSPGAITPRYFDTLKIPVLYGRPFNEHDTAESLPVAIVDEKLARRYWSNESPLGKRIWFGFEGSSERPIWREIVGVVGEIKNLGLSEQPKEQYYYPFSQSAESGMCLMVRTHVRPDTIFQSVRKQIRALDPDQPLSYLTTVGVQMDGLLAPQKLPALLVSGFALLALGLAGIGLYGVIAYATRQRMREFGIRLALGAHRGQLIWLVLRQGLTLVAIGLAIGLGGAFALARLLSRIIQDIHPGDFRVQLLTALVLAAVALAACWLPARRAAKTDPMVALRCE